MKSPSRIFDLTHPLRIGTEGFPTCARIIGWHMREISWSNYNMLHISTDLHTGTHLDSMLHCMPGGTDTAQLPLEHCVGSAAIVDLRHKSKKGDVFEVTDFEPHAAKIRAHGKLLLKTGWSKTWETPAYHVEFPGFSADAAKYVVGLGIHLIGLEQASVHPTNHLEIHRIFFEKNVIIVEGLTDLEPVPVDVVDFCAVPWRLEGGDGSPVRAFCRC